MGSRAIVRAWMITVLVTAFRMLPERPPGLVIEHGFLVRLQSSIQRYVGVQNNARVRILVKVRVGVGDSGL